MPIVGTPFGGGNVSDWSHSTVFTVNVTSLDNVNLPPLTTLWTAPSNCVNRWMLQPSPTLTSSFGTITIGTTAPPDGASTTITKVVKRLVARDGTVNFAAYSTSPVSGASISDSLYTSCQPYSLAPTYSPGVCPEGETVAEVTLYQSTASGGTVNTYYQASCCRSGMSFGSEYPKACLSNISEPFQVYQPFTTMLDSTGTPVIEFDYPTYTYISSGSGSPVLSSYTLSNTTTITQGLAIADPIVVAWQMQDFSLMPTGYASSLATKIGVPWDASTSASPASSSHLPSETNSPPATKDRFSTSAKAGIGVGVVLGVAAVIGVLLIWWCLRRRRRNSSAVAEGREVAELEEHDQMLAGRKWFLHGRWRNETAAKERRNELDSKPVNVIPGPPVELDAGEQERSATHNPNTHVVD